MKTRTFNSVSDCGIAILLIGLFAIASSANAQERTWTDPTGKHQTVAKLLNCNATSVTLLKQNGVKIVVPLNRLCDADVAYVKNLLAAQSPAADSESPKIPAESADVPLEPALPRVVETVLQPMDLNNRHQSPADRPPVAIDVPVSKSSAQPIGLNLVATPDSDKETANQKAVSKVISFDTPEHLPSAAPNLVDMSAERQLEISNDEIRARLDEKNYYLVRSSLNDLLEAWPERPLPELLSTLADCTRTKNKFVRLAALQVLVRNDLDGSFDVLVDCVDDSSFNIRWLAFDSLGELNDDRALILLMKKFASEDSSKVASVVASFGSRAEERVLPFLEESSKNVRLEACNLLAKIGTAKSLTPLKNLRDDDTELAVRYQARNAVERIELRLNSASAN